MNAVRLLLGLLTILLAPLFAVATASDDARNPLAVDCAREIENPARAARDYRVYWRQEGLRQSLLFVRDGEEYLYRPQPETARLELNATEFIVWPGTGRNYCATTWLAGVRSQWLILFDLSAGGDPEVFHQFSAEEIYFEMISGQGLKVTSIEEGLASGSGAGSVSQKTIFWRAEGPSATIGNGAVPVREARLEGNFTDSEQTGTISLRAVPRDRQAGLTWDRPVEGITEDGLIVAFADESLQILSEDPGHAFGDADAAEITLPPAAERYDHVSLDRVCRDPETGLDRLLLMLRKLGTVNADVADNLYVGYDPAAGTFVTRIIPARYLEGTCSLALAEERRSRDLAVMAVGLRRYQSLRPVSEAVDLPAEGCTATGLAGRTVTEDQVQALRQVLARLNREDRAWRGEAAGEPRFNFEELAADRHWRLAAATFYEPWSSWGLLLVRDNRSGTWRAFYPIPPGGSKVDLFLPEIGDLRGDLLTLKLCTDCSGWGVYAPFTLDLASLTLRGPDCPDAPGRPDSVRGRAGLVPRLGMPGTAVAPGDYPARRRTVRVVNRSEGGPQ